MRALYVTGTDTGIGKTLSSCAILHALRARGLRSLGMKPVASGCASGEGMWRNDDALALQRASSAHAAYADINPFAFEHPLAPELAASDDGAEVTLAPICAAFARLQAQADAVVVEGVGGWASPLSATLMQVDVVRALQLPVVLVVGLRLGCLNQALLSARALVADGVPFVGWIASHMDPHMERVADNLRMLSERLPVPCWGTLPHAPEANPAAMASHLHIPTVL